MEIGSSGRLGESSQFTPLGSPRRALPPYELPDTLEKPNPGTHRALGSLNVFAPINLRRAFLVSYCRVNTEICSRADGIDTVLAQGIAERRSEGPGVRDLDTSHHKSWGTVRPGIAEKGLV